MFAFPSESWSMSQTSRDDEILQPVELALSERTASRIWRICLNVPAGTINGQEISGAGRGLPAGRAAADADDERPEALRDRLIFLLADARAEILCAE